ncbi:hypothetical protein [Microbacterium timonense]|uniref:hypothetical protein n=1 Tax=Microbacterium timonense TaxID=2086576 RepID=UPI0011B22967|nr:hypothetical protein [Microbacterium timonense]
MNGVRRVAAVVALAGALCLVATPPAATEAAWADAENAGGAFTAGTVTPVTQMSCTSGLLQPVTFTWTAPSGGLTRTGYRWTVTGGLTGNGTLAADATSVSLTRGLLGLGSGTFSLYAVGPGGWESVVKTGSLGFVTVVLDVVSSCSVP